MANWLIASRQGLQAFKHRLPRINGRRGAFQILFSAVFWCMTAACYIALDFPPGIAWITDAFDIWTDTNVTATPALLAPVWAVPAAAASLGAFLSRPKDWFSFAALTFAPMFYACLYLIGGVVNPHGTSMFGVILYLALGGAVMVVSGMTGDNDRDLRKTAS